MESFRLTDLPLIAWYIGVLVFLEGLLSADNALVLAVMVRHLSRHDRRRVLAMGDLGRDRVSRSSPCSLSTNPDSSFGISRFSAAFISCISRFRISCRGGHSSSEGTKPEVEASRLDGSGFWGTVASMTRSPTSPSRSTRFSRPSPWPRLPRPFRRHGKMFIVLTGGVLGIITMRFVVRYFVSLLDRFPGLAEGAYCLVAWIGFKLTISGFHDEEYLPFQIPERIFWTGMALIAVVSILIKPRKRSPANNRKPRKRSTCSKRTMARDPQDGESDDHHGPRGRRIRTMTSSPRGGESDDDQVPRIEAPRRS